MPRYTSTGISNAIASNRISYTFDLHGPNFAVDTACSSTAVALHQAILNLRANESKIAIVCGSNLILNPDMFIHMSELGFLSPDGLCKAFDKNANGYARGEGVACLILKPLNLAIFDNDPIQAIIRGTNVNQDGKTQGISQPSAVAQEENAASLYRRLGIDPAHTQYVEAHVSPPPSIAAIYTNRACVLSFVCSLDLKAQCLIFIPDSCSEGSSGTWEWN